MIIKRRSPSMRHVSRNRLNCAWLVVWQNKVGCEDSNEVRRIQESTRRHFGKKAASPRDEWHNLLHLFNIMNNTTFSRSTLSNSHLFLSDGKHSEMSKRSQESSSPKFSNGESKNVLSRLAGTAYLWDKILRVTLKARGVRDTLKSGTWTKGIQTREVILFSQPRETVILVRTFWKSLRFACHRKPWIRTKGFSECENSTRTQWKCLTSIDGPREDVHLNMDAICDFIDEGGIAHGPELREEFGSVQEFWIWEYWKFAENYEYDDWRDFRN